jgi:hypothetical protein
VAVPELTANVYWSKWTCMLHINVKIDVLFDMLRSVKVSLYVTCIIGRFCVRKWTCMLHINVKIDVLFYMLRSVKVSLYVICIIGRFCGRT